MSIFFIHKNKVKEGEVGEDVARNEGEGEDKDDDDDEPTCLDCGECPCRDVFFICRVCRERSNVEGYWRVMSR